MNGALAKQCSFYKDHSLRKRTCKIDHYQSDDEVKDFKELVVEKIRTSGTINGTW